MKEASHSCEPFVPVIIIPSLDIHTVCGQGINSERFFSCISE